MENIRCPSCGSPVMVHGDQWECGWCCDSGSLASLQESEQAKVYQNLLCSAALQDLEDGVLSIIEGIQEHFGAGDQETLLAFQLTVYGISHALLPAKNPSQANLSLLRAFFNAYPVCTAAEVLGAVRSGTAPFADQFRIAEEDLGTFWKQLLPQLPHYEASQAWPNWLLETVTGVSKVESIFSGEDGSTLLDRYQNVLDTHWRTYQIHHPDRSALEDAVRRWDFSENDWICRDLLIAAFPETVSRWSADTLLDMSTMDILAETGRQAPKTAIQMMKLLLDTSEAHLQKPEAAELLLGNDMYDVCLDQAVQFQLLEQLKKDDRLAQQLFQSAYVGQPQEDLLDACDWFGEPQLKKQLQERLEKNPYFHPL